jgi:hypothetical protein
LIGASSAAEAEKKFNRAEEYALTPGPSPKERGDALGWLEEDCLTRAFSKH